MEINFQCFFLQFSKNGLKTLIQLIKGLHFAGYQSRRRNLSTNSPLQGINFSLRDKLVVEMVDVFFDDAIKVDRLDPDGKKFDKVSRIEAQSEEYAMNIQLDVNTEVYPIRVGEKFRMALAPTLNLDGSAVTGYIPEGKSKSLADKFEYVMHGLLYKMSEDDSSGSVKVIAYISFGGLQLMLKGDPIHMGKFKLDQRLFLLMRKM